MLIVQWNILLKVYANIYDVYRLGPFLAQL